MTHTAGEILLAEMASDTAASKLIAMRPIPVGFHEVAAGIYHGKIVVRPENLGRWQGHALMKDGQMVFGGGPDSSLSVHGPLMGAENRESDVAEPSVECHELRPMFGKSEDDVIENLIQNTKNYSENPKPQYTLLPLGTRELQFE